MEDTEVNELLAEADDLLLKLNDILFKLNSQKDIEVFISTLTQRYFGDSLTNEMKPVVYQLIAKRILKPAIKITWTGGM